MGFRRFPLGFGTFGQSIHFWRVLELFMEFSDSENLGLATT